MELEHYRSERERGSIDEANTSSFWVPVENDRVERRHSRLSWDRSSSSSCEVEVEKEKPQVTRRVSTNVGRELEKSREVASRLYQSKTRQIIEDRGKERQLQKKVTELTTQVTRLEKRVTILKTENDSLKKKGEEQKPSEEKIKKLKKRNAELAAIARRLEEKAKQLQQENVKRSRGLEHSPAQDDQVKKMLARQRSKDLAEHGKSLLEKNKEIEMLRQKCQELTEQLTNSDQLQLQNPEFYQDKEEMENIIKQAAKERLRLERQVSKQKVGESAELSQLRALEETNSVLQVQVQELTLKSQEQEKLEIEVTQRRIECETLYKEISEAQRKCAHLESELQDAIEKNTQLTIQNSDLQQRLNELEKVNEECAVLKANLTEVESECQAAKSEVNTLNDKVKSLEEVIQHMQEDAVRNQELQQEHEATIQELKAQEEELRMLSQEKEEIEREHEDTIDTLEAKLRELEKNYELQTIKHKELNQEMNQLRQEAELARQRPLVNTIEIQTENDTLNDKMEDNLIGGGAEDNSPGGHKVTPEVSVRTPAVNNASVPQLTLNSTRMILPERPGSSSSNRDDLDSLATEDEILSLGNSNHGDDILNEVGGQDFDADADAEENNEEEENEEEQVEEEILLPTVIKANDPDMKRTIEEVIVALETNNNDPDKDGDQGFPLVADADPILNASPQTDLDLGDDLDLELSDISKKIKALSVDTESEEEDNSQHSVEDQEPPPIDAKVIVRTASPTSRTPPPQENVKSSFEPASLSDSSFPKRTPFQVFVAKYSYDPVQFSPNENPESELFLNAGDYVFVYGTMDEDGFYEGELMDGRHGLLPSNFVEKVADEDLEEFHATFALGQKDDNTLSIQQDLDFNSSDEGERLIELPVEHEEGAGPEEDEEEEEEVAVPETEPGMSDTDGAMLHNIMEEEEETTATEASDVTVSELETKIKGIPFPRNLRLDRQLTNSILIAWASPEGVSANEIQSYHVYVNGEFKSSVKGTERTKALIENVHSSKSHRVVVRTVTIRGQSKDPECTILIGKDSTLAPSELKVNNLTSTSATLSWLPGDSNYEHIVAVNGIDTRITKPGIYKVLLAGLTPAKTHRVSVRPKSLKTRINDKNAMATMLMFTTPSGGIPDPPLDVQVEAGPQEGTLLVTWLPVTIDTSGTSNGALVTGYAVYVDGTKTKDVTSPTGDHVILSNADFLFRDPPQAVTMRTVSEDKESSDSNIIHISDQHRQEISKAVVNGNKKSTIEPGQIGEDIEDSGTELSDIAEVEEEEELEEEWAESAPVNHPDSDQTPVVTPVHVPHQPVFSMMSPETPKPPPSGISQPNATSPTSPHMFTFQDDGEDLPSQRTPPRGAESPPKPKSDGIRSPTTMMVPQIEITKDSSGSLSTTGSGVSANDNFSDDEMESAISSTSGIISSKQQSPISPDRHFYQHNHKNHNQPSKMSPPDGKYDPKMDARDGYRDDVYNPNQEPHKSSPQRPLSGKRGEGDRVIAERPLSGRKRRDYIEPEMRQVVDPDQGPSVSRSPYSDNGFVDEILDNNEISPRKIREDIPDSDLIDYEDDGEGESLVDDEAEMEFDESKIAIFIALFDYDPLSMSPNPDAADEELPFKEGQLIKIYGDKDVDGFYMGEIKGQRGLVPGNMVSEVQVDDPEIAAQLLNESNRMETPRRQTPGGAATPSRHTPGYSTPGHVDRHLPGYNTPGFNTPGYNTPGYNTPSNPQEEVSHEERRKEARYNGRHDDRVPDIANDERRREVMPDERCEERRGGDRRYSDERPSERRRENRDDHRQDRHEDRYEGRREREDRRYSDRSREDRREERYHDDRKRESRHHDDDRRREGRHTPSRHRRESRDSPSHRPSSRSGVDTGGRHTPSGRSGSAGRHTPSSREHRHRDGHHRDGPHRDRERSHRDDQGPRNHRERHSPRSRGDRRSRSRSPNGFPPMPADGPMKRMVAVYDYDPSALSPNVDCELELAFVTGDIVHIFGEMDEDGFFMGEDSKGHQGLVPSNFLQEAPLDSQPGGSTSQKTPQSQQVRKQSRPKAATGRHR